jgi:uncharacterized protein (DUF1684 family)
VSIELLDYRRQMAEAYASLRSSSDSAAAVEAFRRWKDGLFLAHPQSPLDDSQRRGFSGLSYFPYDAAYRVAADVVFAETTEMVVPLSEGEVRLRRFAKAEFSLPSGRGTLDVYWIEGYGGGLFVPFADATSGQGTYGGGRYLLDTIKGADLGMEGDRLVFDFNLAYQPSCAYNPRWICPLAPPGSRLPFAVPAGERYDASLTPFPRREAVA